MQDKDYMFAKGDIPAHLFCKTEEVRPGTWRASTDLGFDDDVSWPSFAKYASSKADAEEQVKAAVASKLCNYDLRYKAGKHFARKQRFLDAGIDPDQVSLGILKGDDTNPWWDVLDDSTGWLNRVKHTRHLEFFTQLLTVEAKAEIEAGTIPPEEAIAGILEDVPEHASWSPFRGEQRMAIQDYLSERLSAELAPLPDETPTPE